MDGSRGMSGGMTESERTARANEAAVAHEADRLPRAEVNIREGVSPAPSASPVRSSSRGTTGAPRAEPGASTREASRSASVYVHFPYCLAKCPYCDFVSYATERSDIDHRAYADAVLAELEARRGWIEGRTIGSVFFGGGTPSLWEPSELGRVLRAILASQPVSPDVEITVECNPTSLDGERARAFRDFGVNRLSIGTQSLRRDQLEFLGRLHDPSGARRALTEALAVPGLRVSTDFIFGLPDQAPEDARAQAVELADLGLRHLSCYQLTIEPGTAFGDLARRGRLPLADDGRVAEAFLAIHDALAAFDLRHYEISNYAVAGEEARHNLGYWRGDEYLGLGCAAFGFVRLDDPSAESPARAVRYRNVVRPERYLAAAGALVGRAPGSSPRPGGDEGGADPLLASAESLDAEQLLRERIMLGLRLEDGLDLAAAARDLGIDPWTDGRVREAQRLVARGRLEHVGDRLRVPHAAWLWSDDTAARLF